MQNNNGAIPLHFAAVGDNRKIAKLLLDNGANVNAVTGGNKSKVTPIFFSRSQDMVELLMEYGALSSRCDFANSVLFYNAGNKEEKRIVVVYSNGKVVETTLSDEILLSLL